MSPCGTLNLLCASQVWLALLLLMLPPCPRPYSLVVPHDPSAEYKVENNAGPLRREWSLRWWPFRGIIELKTTNTHELDGIITMEYHCVLFTVLLQLIIQPGRTTFIIYWCFCALTLLREKIPESLVIEEQGCTSLAVEYTPIDDRQWGCLIIPYVLLKTKRVILRK